MHGINLRSVDLNLLLVLHALLTERHITRAANRLNMSQPAVSHALGRLRALFADRILIRCGQEMRLGGTVRAGSSTELALAEALRAAEEGGADTRLLGGAFLATLPVFDPGPAGPTPGQVELIAALADADGVIVASPGYHGAISGVMKNAFDTLELARTGDRPYLADLPVGIIITAGGWQAAGTALVTMRTIVHALRGWPTPFGATLNTSEGLFADDGRCRSEKDGTQLATVAGQVMGFARMKQAVAA